MRHCILPIMLAVLCLGCQTTALAAGDSTAADIPGRGDWLYLWSGDQDRSHDDFLAVVDVRKGSSTYAHVVASVPVGKSGTFPHHTEHELAGDGRLFANGFGSGDTFVFDLRKQGAPSLVTRFGPPGPYRQPHSYARLPNGNVLATLQSTGDKYDGPGGLMEFGPDGTLLRTVSAADSAVDDRFLPYSLSVVAQIGRVVTTSADMHERWVSRVVQVWRLPELDRVSTLQLPPGPGGKEGWDPAEPRVLSDGRTVMLSTFNCGLYLMEGLESEAPGARFVHAFEGGGCALPVVVGDYWIQTVPDAHALVVLDIQAPEQPREVSRIELGADFKPHWISASPDGRRLVLTGYGPRVLLFDFDRDNGRIAIDTDFRDPGAQEPGLSMARTHWPHGESGPAVPHGAVFQ
ncbi:hypothetical protein BH23PSE2_BH23PSE2_04930 [soil metagenome]